jgi:pimeloyl-ACP methyl ester carboxylesterase
MTSILLVLAISAGVLLLGLVYQFAGKQIDRRRFPLSGQHVLVNGRRIHVTIRGAGETVVLESGIASTSLAWALVEPVLAKETRVITYDRAGLGRSDCPRTPRTLANIVDELRAVLELSGAPKPYILVGHSFGGLIVRNYAVRFPDDCAGLVLVDAVDTRDWSPLSEAQRIRLARGVGLSRRGALLARFGVVRLALTLLASGSRRLPKLIARCSSGKGTSVTERLIGEVRKLPPELWPFVQMHWCDQRCFTTMAEYLERLPENASAADAQGWPAGIPITALTVSGSAPGLPAGVTHRCAETSGHWIQLDEPELVVSAVREFLSAKSAQIQQRPA